MAVSFVAKLDFAPINRTGYNPTRPRWSAPTFVCPGARLGQVVMKQEHTGSVNLLDYAIRWNMQ